MESSQIAREGTSKKRVIEEYSKMTGMIDSSSIEEYKISITLTTDPLERTDKLRRDVPRSVFSPGVV